jgi:hypothetical protein
MLEPDPVELLPLFGGALILGDGLDLVEGRPVLI